MTKRVVLVAVCLALCVIVATKVRAADTNNTMVKDQEIATDSHQGSVWLRANTSSQGNPKSDTQWLHYDDGTCEYSYGLVDGGYWLHEAIVLTPAELTGYSGDFVSVKVMHGDDISHHYAVWVYKNIDHPSGNPLVETTIVATGESPAAQGWVTAEFTTPIPFDDTDTVWIGVGWYQPNMYRSPAAFDTDNFFPGKSDWLWTSEYGMIWLEMSDFWFYASWGLRVGLIAQSQIFSDGFESGDTSAWSAVVGER